MGSRSSVGGFERFWNSTFGVPQQVLLRMLRAMQDDEVSLLSRDGLLDPSLIPIAGIFTGDRRDVTMGEAAQRLGLPEGFGGELAAGILTDPLTYMTFGLSASAKAARGAEMALRNPQVGKAVLGGQKRGVAELLKGGFKREEILKGIDDAMAAGSLSAKDVRRMGKARKLIEKAPEGANMTAMRAAANEKDLVFGVPLLHRYGLGVTVAKNEKSWFRYLSRQAKGSAGGKALAHAARPMMKVPVLGAAMGTIAKFGEGFKDGGKALRMFDPERAPQNLQASVEWLQRPGRGEVMDAVRDRSFGDVYARYVELSERSDFTPQRALVSAIYGSASKNPKKYDAKFAEIWNALTGDRDDVKKFLDVFEGGRGTLDSKTVEVALRDFMDNAKRHTDALWDGQEAMKLTEVGKRESDIRKLALHGGAGEKSKYKAFKFGRAVRQAQRRLFKSDGSVEELMAFEQSLRKLQAKGTEYLQRIGRDGAKLLREASDEAGVDPDDFDRFFNSWLQASGAEDELTVLQHFTDPTQAKTADSLINTAARLNTATQQVMRFVTKGGKTNALKRLSEQVSAMMGRGLSKDEATNIMAVYGGDRSLTTLVEDADFLTEITAKGIRSDGVRVLEEGDYRFLAEIPDDELAYFHQRTESPYLRAEIEAVLEGRESGKTRLLRRPSPGTTKEVPQGSRTAGTVLEAKPSGSPSKPGAASQVDVLNGRLSETAALLFANGHELRRAIREGVPITPAIVQDSLNIVNRHGRVMDELLAANLGEAGQRYFKWLRQVQRETLAEAVQNGIIGTGLAPLAYVGRVMGPSMAKIEAALKNEKFASVIDKALPKLGSSFLRNMDAMTVEELNLLYRNVMEQSGPRAKEFVEELDAIALAETGEKFGKYTESPHLAMMTRLAQGVQRSTTRGAFYDALEAGHKSGAMRGGKVVGYITKSQRVMRVGDTPRTKGRLSGALGHIKYDRKELERDFGGLLVEGWDGEEYFIGPEMFGSGGSLVNLGKYDLSERIIDEAGTVIDRELADQVELAFSNRAARGQLSPHEILGMQDDITKRLEEFDGAYIGWGDESALAGSFSALQKNYAKSDEMLVAYDLAQQAVKAWQTTMRPSFHIANIASLVPMMSTIGVKAHNTVWGMFDAHRFLGENLENWDQYSRLGTISAGAKGKTGFVPRTSRFAQAVRRGVDEIPDADLVFRAKDGSEYGVGEILKAVADSGLLGTFVSQGMRGSSRVSESMRIIREAALKHEGGFKGFAKRFAKGATLGKGEWIEAQAEMSEIFARMSAVFGQLREGIPLNHAVENAKQALVDYANITQVERSVMKRVSTYYTFPRHYLPQAWNKFAQDPAYMANLASVLRSKGVVRDNQGRTEVDLGPLGILNYDRMNPNLEAVKLLQAIGHMFLGGTSAVTPVDEASRQSRLQGAPSQPFTPGSAFSALYAALDGNDRTSAMEEVANAFWLTRFIIAPDDPYGEKTNLVKAFESTVIPVKADTPVRHRKMLVGRFYGIISELERKAETADPETRAQLRAEARRLTQVVKDKFEEFE